MTAGYFSNLTGHQYLCLTTFRKSGQPVATPVWFVNEAGRLYVLTSAKAGKAKRIQNVPKVLVEPSDGQGRVLGPGVEAVARVLPAAKFPMAKQALDRKYGWVKKLFNLYMSLQRAQIIYLEIVPI
jgi:hypothetical protein